MVRASSASFASVWMAAVLLLASGNVALSFAPRSSGFSSATPTSSTSSSALSLFDKFFEEEGPLGKGITVGKVQVALMTTDRSKNSIFGDLKRTVDEHSVGTNYDLACLAQQTCLALLRRKDSWTAAASTCQWFKEDDSGKAESTYNDWANREAVKFEKEYPPGTGDGGASTVVVSLLLELVGDQTQFDGAGLSFTQTEEVLQSIASDVMVEEGDCVNACELFWTPGEPTEVLTKMDLIQDFPELMTI